jgi:small subunit ribosomal protein S17
MSNRTKIGIASSTKMDKTVVVMVHTYKRHPKYHKRYRTSSKFYAHDEQNEVREGDTVTIQEMRPLSKLKRWNVISIESSLPVVSSGSADVAKVEELEQVQQFPADNSTD